MEALCHIYCDILLMSSADILMCQMLRIFESKSVLKRNHFSVSKLIVINSGLFYFLLQCWF